MAYGNYNADWQSGGKSPGGVNPSNQMTRPMRGRTMGRYTAAFGRQGARDQRRGAEAEDWAWNNMQGFDATDAAMKTNQAQQDQVSEQQSHDLMNLQGQLSGMGNLRSGFGTSRQMDLFDRNLQLRNRQMGANSMQANQQNLQNTQMGMQYGMGTSGRYLDILAGNRDADFNERNLQMQKDQGAWWRQGLQGLMGGIGSGIGMWLPGLNRAGSAKTGG